MGLEDKELFPKVSSSIMTNAILDDFSGTATDLWMVTKLKVNRQTESAPIMREILFEPQYSIYYSVSDSSSIDLKRIIDSFSDPVFALSLGRSDEMIEVKDCTKVNLDPALDQYFKNTILPFNYKAFFDRYDNLPLRKGQTFSLPQVMSIPISFKIDGGGIRTPLENLQVTMVYDRAVKIKDRHDGWVDDEHRKFFLY